LVVKAVLVVLLQLQLPVVRVALAVMSSQQRLGQWVKTLLRLVARAVQVAYPPQPVLAASVVLQALYLSRMLPVSLPATHSLPVVKVALEVLLTPLQELADLEEQVVTLQ
jgi:hypothetical protein